MTDAAQFVLPKDDQRLVIIGRTGTGKTYAGAWQLAMRRFDRIPWIIFDYKGDKLLNDLGATEIQVGYIPKKPGLYIVHPLPSQKEEVEQMMWKIWSNERIGLFIDEGYMIGDSEAFRALLTQGRSKKIPMIILSQRPSWLSRFVFSEANFYQVFHLNDKEDRKTMSRYLGDGVNIETRLPEYQSVYYSVDNDTVTVLAPAPDQETLFRVVDRKNALTKERLRAL
jgi:hypothetical protein